jgi:hypothetical protein
MPNISNNLNISLAEYKPLKLYKPRVGDFVIWHGWFTHYYGIIGSISMDKIKIIKAGMPLLLMTMDSDDMDKNSIIVNLNKIKKSGGWYAIQQAGVWYL